MRVTKFFFKFCVILLITMFASGTYIMLHSADDGPKRAPVPIAYHRDGVSSIRNFRIAESSASKDPPVNLIVLGLDEGGTRSDVILLFNFDPNQSRLNILSIARDTLVKTGGKITKINALYSKGGEILLADKVSEITGLPVHYYVSINLKGFRKIVDTLDGVSFYVPFRMSYDDPTQNLHIHLRKGFQVLNGKKAEQLVRYRKGNYKGQGYTDGDIGRIKMQQDFIKAMIEQKLNLRYISKADDVFELLRQYVNTNVKFTDIAQYIGSIRKISAEETNAVTLPGTSRMIGDAWYFILDGEEANSILEGFYK